MILPWLYFASVLGLLAAMATRERKPARALGTGGGAWQNKRP